MKKIPIYKLKNAAPRQSKYRKQFDFEIIDYALIDDEDYKKCNEYKWFKTNKGYARTYKIPTGMHRLVMNAQRGQYVDHIDHNPLNNQKSNLRFCTKTQNGMNRIKQKKNSSSKFKGVCWDKFHSKWVVLIKVNTKRKFLGSFNSEIEAAKAYNEAALKYFGKFAKLNDVN